MSRTTKPFLYLSFLVALLAMGGSLYFSEILKLPPCLLCWYQRIAMYPIVFILFIGILKRATDLYRYVLPLSLLGLVIATYHNLLYYGIIPESLAPCTSGIPCTTHQIALFGFLSIPTLSLLSFLVIVISMIFYRRNIKINQNISHN